MSNPVPKAIGNQILAALPAEDYNRISSQLQPVEFRLSEIVYRPGEEMKHVYFPTNSMISLISQLSDGASVEIGVAGYESMVGISSILGVYKSPFEALVQYPDGAMRMRTDVLKEEFNRGGALHDLLLRYLQLLLLQTSQIAACNRLHTVSERLARWLLMSQDRCRCDELPFTQEFLAMMLGTRRPSVTEAAVTLNAEGYIDYRRGRITIKDRKGLEQFTCECYTVIKEEFDRLPG